MKIVFRSDASLQIGSGHIMRCLTLADALKAAGAHCSFICREHQGNLIEQIRRRGFAVSVLPIVRDALVAKEMSVTAQPNYAAWLGAYWAVDAEQTKTSIGNIVVDWMIVDHYAIDARWEEMLRPMCRKLMVIDDLANRPHDCDLLLDQNLGRDTEDYDQFIPKGCTVLAGPYYALLRSEFAKLRNTSLARRTAPKLKHLLITMGGVDREDATGKTLEILMDCQLPTDMRITIVMGSHAPGLGRVQLLAERMRHPTEVKVDVDDMARLMADSDLAIGAAGSTAWERCCLGLPTLVVVLAENQRSIASALEKKGCVQLLDSVDAIPHVLTSMINLFDTSDALSQLSHESSFITDGRGTCRVTAALVANND